MSARLHVNLDLIRKYDLPGPRYTSYPTAVEFTEDFSRDALLLDLRAGNRFGRPLSLYFHLPFCETLCWFCGCTTVIGRERGRADTYLDYLNKELALTARELNPDSRVVQVHFGGGTPNFLSPIQIARLAAMLREHFSFDADAEVGVELDPRRLTLEQVQAFRELGANRASFGIQDFEPAVQEGIHRIQPKEVSDRAALWIRQAGFQSLNLDLIYGLPRQTPDSFGRTLELALELRPDRLAMFSYAHMPRLKPAQKLLPMAEAPSSEDKLIMLQQGVETLTERGYVYIGMDHFAREDDELAVAQRAGTLQRNFQGYSTRAGVDIYAFGMSSISQTTTHYRQNDKTLDAYYARLDAGQLPVARARFLSGEDILRRSVIMRLMCDLSLDYRALSKTLDIDFAGHFAPELAAFAGAAADGLVNIDENMLTVTESGRLLIRNLAMTFDAYLGKAERHFSRTI
jgi:oxygen-independent coproporphyrinogen-3 oxidase